MNQLFDPTIYAGSTWVIPVLLAITLHEAAHGYVAHAFGDDTAWQLGRVSLNPLRHVDPFGTVLLPALLLLSHAPFLFGYAKPVPVRFDRLRNPRRDMVWVAAAGPGMNLALAIVAALLIHAVGYLPLATGQWVLWNLVNAININVILAVFNMIPLPPLSSIGRTATLFAIPFPTNNLLPPFARIGLAAFDQPALDPDEGPELFGADTKFSRVRQCPNPDLRHRLRDLGQSRPDQKLEEIG